MAHEALVLILVHGTWAPKAPWTLDGSRFVKSLREAFPDIQRVKSLEWTGANSFKARWNASKQIAEYLDSLQSHEEAIVCAHSHGGGALCYALQDRPNLANKVKAAVFLGTPFFLYRLLPSRRAVLDGIFTPIIFIYIAILAAASTILLTVIDYIIGIHSDSLVLFAFAILGVWIVAGEISVQILAALNRYKRRRSRRIVDDASLLVKRLSCELPAGLNALFVRVSADEAAVGLNFATALLWPMISINAWYGWFFSGIIVPYRTIRLRRPIRYRLTFYAVAGVLMSGFFFRVTHTWIVLPLLALAGAYLLVGYAMAITNWLISCSFGRVPFLPGAIVQPAAEPVPPGAWKLDHVAWGTLSKEVEQRSLGLPKQVDLRSLRHSRLYDDPKIISSIIAWLQGK
jgi:hypothetical protein